MEYLLEFPEPRTIQSYYVRRITSQVDPHRVDPRAHS